MRPKEGRRRALVVFEVAAVFLMASTLLLLPWTIYTGFVREARYGLLNQSFAGWLGEQVIGLFVTLVIGSLLFVVIYAVIRRMPKNWWMVSTGRLGLPRARDAVRAGLYPAAVQYLFRTAAGPVRDRIVAMAKAYDVPAEHIYVYDASKQTKRISANVSGIGPSVRISLNDNLLHRATEPEILAAVGHEMGHYVLGHVWRSWIWLTALYGLMLFLAAWVMPLILARYGARWNIRDVADPASMPLLAGVFVVFSLMVTPITNTLVRVTERDADVFGLDAAHEPDGFASLSMKLSEYRKIDPGPVEEALFYDHPSGATRVRLAMRWKQIHMPGAPMAKPTPIVLEPMDAQH
jgi:STE24 endopeptidase